MTLDSELGLICPLVFGRNVSRKVKDIFLIFNHIIPEN